MDIKPREKWQLNQQNTSFMYSNGKEPFSEDISAINFAVFGTRLPFLSNNENVTQYQLKIESR